MSEEQRVYKITHVVEFIAYVQASSERQALAMNYCESYFQQPFVTIWDGRIDTISETVEQVAEIPREGQEKVFPPVVECPCVKATILIGDTVEQLWIPVKLLLEEGLDEAVNTISIKKCSVIACNQKKYYVDGTDEPWQPISEQGGEQQ